MYGEATAVLLILLRLTSTYQRWLTRRWQDAHVSALITSGRAETKSHGVTLTVLRTVCRSTPYPGTTQGSTSCRGRMTLFWSSATRTTKRSVGIIIIVNKDTAYSYTSTQSRRRFLNGINPWAARRQVDCSDEASFSFFCFSFSLKSSVQTPSSVQNRLQIEKDWIDLKKWNGTLWVRKAMLHQLWVTGLEWVCV